MVRLLRKLPESLIKDFTPATKAVLKCALNAALSLPTGLSRDISQQHVRSFIKMIGVALSGISLGTKAEREQLEVLRDYYRYRTRNEGNFTIPQDDSVIQNIMAFAIKAAGHDQIDRFVKERAITHSWISSALWGACIGFASLPKTFTNPIYDSKNEQLLDETDD